MANYDVFISYSAHDQAFVEWLIKKFGSSGISVWYDQNEITVGDSILTKIDEGIKSCSFIIIILSKNSMKSDWVNTELNMALVHNAQKQGVKILPVLREEVKIPTSLSTIRYADFTKDKESAFTELLQVIKQKDHGFFQLQWEQLTPLSFEGLINDLLIREGFDVVQTTLTSADYGYDFIVYNHQYNEKRIVEVKFYKNTKLSMSHIARLYGAAKLSNANAIMLVTNSYFTTSAKRYIEKIDDMNVYLWDGTDLSELLNKHYDLNEKYFTSIPVEHNDVKIMDSGLIEINNLIRRLKECPEGKKGWKEYEDICVDILTHIFVPPLKKPKIQKRTESGIDVRDALFPNRCDEKNWRFIRDDYDAKYVLFEFKNYSLNDKRSNIDKSVVNQVRNYLKQTIGRIGFVCSKKIPNKSGYEAQKQTYIEDKKLIIFLNNEYLIEMLMKFYRGEDPSDILLDLIDEFNLNFG